jgi:hypothetical protein
MSERETATTPSTGGGVGAGDCTACRVVGAGACFGAAAWVGAPLPAGVGAPRPVRLAAAAVAVGLGVARLLV